jgi:hypothetical protein
VAVLTTRPAELLEVLLVRGIARKIRTANVSRRLQPDVSHLLIAAVEARASWIVTTRTRSSASMYS